MTDLIAQMKARAAELRREGWTISLYLAEEVERWVKAAEACSIPDASTLDAEARDLVNRLRGRYAVGPIMANGEPEFGYRVFDRVPAIPDEDGTMKRPGIYEQAAQVIEALLSRSFPKRENQQGQPCPMCGGVGVVVGLATCPKCSGSGYAPTRSPSEAP